MRSLAVFGLTLLFENLSNNFGRSSAIHLGADLRDRIFSVGRKLAELDQSISIGVAMEERVTA
jgi:hypothetical protein